MEHFELSEIIGREKAVALLHIYELTPSEDRYSAWDLSGCTAPNIAGDVTPFLIEVKNRDVSIRNYPTAYIEVTKYQGLMQVATANNIEDIFYLNFYVGGTACAFNLKNFQFYNLITTVKYVPETDTPGSPWVWKAFFELPMNKGTAYPKKK